MSSQVENQLNPFPGLRPFRSDEHHLFFGREEQTAVLLKLLRSYRFLAIVGTSGSGKSSLVRAGMIPELYGGTMTQAGSSWEVVVLRPGGSPVENLARSLIEADFYDGEDPDTLLRLRATLSRSRFGLVEAVKQSDLLEPGTNLLVVVDQFEELFRFRQQGIDSEETAAAFVNLLLTASTQAECPIYVAITMRSDYLGDCSEIPGLAEAVNEGEYLIPRLSRDQKRDAIEKPIGVGGAKISPLLAQRLLNDVGDDPDQLPVLQHALMRMWDVWSAAADPTRPIDFSDFEATGGIEAALSHHADEIYEALPDEEHRAACEKIFKTLTEKGTDNRGIRRPTRLAELEAIAGVDRATATKVLDAFRQHGVTFLMPGPDRELGERTVLDLSHESLMRGWQRLRGWVEEEAQSARIFQRLRDTAWLWRDGKAGLFRDPDLQIAISWREQQRPNAQWGEQYGGHFDEANRFLDESVREATAAEQALEAARQRELARARALAETERLRAEEQERSAYRLRWFIRGLGLVVMVTILALVMAVNARRLATENAQLASEQQARAEEAGKRSRQLAETLKSTLTRADFASAADQLEAGHADRSLTLLARSLRTDPSYAPSAFRAMETLSSQTFAVAPPTIFKQDKPIKGWGTTTNRFIWTVDLEDRGFLWDIDAKKRIAPLADGKQVEKVQFTDDGNLVFTAIPGENTIRGWQADTGAAATPEIKPGPGFGDYALSPETKAGRFLVVKTAAGALQIWDAAKGEPTAPPLKTGGKATSFGISPDGRFVFGDFDDQTLGVWSLPDGKAMLGPVRHGLATSEVRFSPDSQFLVLRSEGAQQLTWWTLEDPGSPGKNAELGAPPRELLFESVSHRVVTASWEQGRENQILRLQTIDLASGERSPLIEEPKMTRIIWPDVDQGKRTIDAWIAGGVFDQRQVKLWDLNTGKILTELPQQEGPIRQAVLSPDASRIALVAENWKSLRPWDVFTGKPIGKAIDLKGPLAGWSGLFFSADGEKLITFHAEGTPLLTVWDARSGESLTQPVAVSDGFVRGRALSRDRTRTINLLYTETSGGGTATAQILGEVALVDIQPGTAETIPLKMGGGIASHVQFSPDGTKLLGTEFNEVIGNPSYAWIWNTTDRRLLHHVKHPAPIRYGDFSPDGNHLLTAAADGLVRIWNTESGEQVNKLSLDADVWMAKYSPNGELIATATSDARMQVWDAASGVALFPPQKHGPFIRSLEFSPDGRQLLTGASDLRARLIHAQTGEAVLPPIEHPDGSGCAATFSPDGKVIFTVSFIGSAIAWNAGTGERIKEMATKESYHQAQFNPQGDVVATGSGGTDEQNGFVQLWDWRKGALLADPLPVFGRAAEVRFSSTGNLIATQTIPGRLKVWDAQTGRLLLERDQPPAPGNALNFSPDGSQLAAGFWDGSVALIDLPSPNERAPGWFPELAETIAGKRLTPQGSMETIGLDQLGAVQAKIPTKPDDSFGQWAHWFLSDRKTRPVSPGSQWTVPELALQLSQDSNITNQFKALRLDPNNGVLYARLGFALTGATIKTNAVGVATNHWNSVVQWYSDQATNLAPGSAEVWALRAGALSAIGQPEPAAAAVERAITLDANNPNAWYLKALTLARQGNPAAGYQAFVKALELLPKRGDAIEWYNRKDKPHLIGALRELLALEKVNPLEMARLGRRRIDDSSDQSDRKFWEAKWLTQRATEVAPDDAEVWRLRSEALFEPADEAEALAAWKKAFDVDAEGNLAWQDYGRFLNARTTIMEQLKRYEEAREYYRPRAIPPRSRNAKPTQIDLSAYFTSSLLESVHRGKSDAVETSYWDKLPTGLQTLAGVEFDVRGLIQLDGSNLRDWFAIKYPRELPGIKVSSKAGWLLFLHTTGWGNQTDGLIIGQYRLHYRDGETRHLPIVLGRDVRDWINNPFVETTHSQIAWAGYCIGGHKTLFMSTWENPRPEVEIDTIDFISDMTQAAPMLVAITLEQPWSQEQMAATPAQALQDMAHRKITQPQGQTDWGKAYAQTLIEAALQKVPNDPGIQRGRAEVLLARGKRDEAGRTIEALLAADADDHAAWNLKARLLADSGSGVEALAAWEKAIGLLAGPDTFDGPERQGRVKEAVEHLKSGGQIAEARKFFLRANIPARDAHAIAGALDLASYYNAALNESWYERGGSQASGAVLKTFPRGIASFLGVRFDVRGVIQLNDRARTFVRTYPNEVAGIQVGRRGNQIHFLHATSLKETVGTPVARYRIHYRNGEMREFPVVYGANLRDFYEPDTKDDTVTAWRGKNITDGRGDVAVFLSSWDNPLPGVEITSIDFVSALSRAQPFLLGITVESFPTGKELDGLTAEASAGLALDKVNPKLRPTGPTIAYAKQLSDHAIAQAPENAEVWQLRGEMLFQLGELEPALAAAEKSIDLNGEASQAWALKADVLEKQRKPADAKLARANVRTRELKEKIPARPAGASPNLIDLTDFYAAALTEEVHTTVGSAENAYSSLSALPKGIQSFDGVGFDVRGVIKLSGETLEMGNQRYVFPRSVSGIQIQQQCKTLHFLQGVNTSAGVPAGTVAGSYLIHYADGGTQEIPLRVGLDFQEWSMSRERKNTVTEATLAWRGPGPTAADPDQELGLYVKHWVNPIPEVAISHLDFVSAMKEPSPFLIAVTVE